MQELFNRLDIDPLHISTLVFAWKLQAKVPFEFSKREFVDGCANLHADSWDKLKTVIRKSYQQHLWRERLHYLLSWNIGCSQLTNILFYLTNDCTHYWSATLRSSLRDFKDFRSFYMYAFEYNKPPEQRSLPIETARQLFPLIFQGQFKHLDLWMDFLKDRRQPISKDTYTLLLDFAQSINGDMSNYDEENGAWPVLLDEFVDFAKPRLKKKTKQWENVALNFELYMISLHISCSRSHCSQRARVWDGLECVVELPLRKAG